jgi:hypothetical protein
MQPGNSRQYMQQPRVVVAPEINSQNQLHALFNTIC